MALEKSARLFLNQWMLHNSCIIHNFTAGEIKIYDKCIHFDEKFHYENY